MTQPQISGAQRLGETERDYWQMFAASMRARCTQRETPERAPTANHALSPQCRWGGRGPARNGKWQLGRRQETCNSVGKASDGRATRIVAF